MMMMRRRKKASGIKSVCCLPLEKSINVGYNVDAKRFGLSCEDV